MKSFSVAIFAVFFSLFLHALLPTKGRWFPLSQATPTREASDRHAQHRVLLVSTAPVSAFPDPDEPNIF